MGGEGEEEYGEEEEGEEDFVEEEAEEDGEEAEDDHGSAPARRYAESALTFDFGARGRYAEPAESIIGPDDSVSNVGHRPCVLRAERRLSQNSGCLYSMSMPTKSVDDSMSQIWTQRNQKSEQGPVAGAHNSRVRRLGELDCGHTRDLTAAMRQDDKEDRCLHLDDEGQCDAMPMPQIEPPPPRKMRMKPSKRLPKQSRQEVVAEEESEIGVTHGGLVFGQHSDARPHDEDEPDLAGNSAAFEARTSRRRTTVRAPHVTDAAESEVTFTCEATEQRTHAAPAQRESHAGDGSGITFACAQHGRVLHDMNVRGRLSADASSPGQRARAPAPQAEFAGAFLIDDADDAPNGATDIGGGDDDVFTTVALSNKPPPVTRLCGNSRWESAKQSSDGGGPFRRI